jgi:glycolate oxidase
MTMNRGAIEQLRKAVGADHVVTEPHDLVIFERDASITGSLPDAIVFPANTAEVSLVLRIAQAQGLAVVPRGAGTGLSGGAVTLRGGIALSLARMHRILEIDPRSRTATVEPGVVNLDLSIEAARHGLFYAPDPSSQKACTIGGNAAENSGGPHCLYYGVTTNHIIGMEVVLADGSVHWVGGDDPDRPGFDLLGVLVGSEGTMCVITRIQVKLLAVPEAIHTLLAGFPTIETASHAVSDVIGHGIVPAALEMMDETTVGAVEAHYHAGYPTDAGAVLLVEVDGLTESAKELIGEIREILERNEAFALRLAGDKAERELLWAGRKGAIGALGRIKPNYYLHDGVVPRTRLPEVLRHVGEIAGHYKLPVANVFHAGDGNLHPNILFDLREEGILEKVEKAGEEMLRACIDAGGTLSGEHGIGLEKNAFMPWIYSPDDLDAMHRVKDTLDPRGLLNPGKVFPDSDLAEPRLVARTGVAAQAQWW